MKSGTTMFHSMLSQCKGIHGSARKEPNYFSQSEEQRDSHAYSKLFDKNARYNLESSTSYTRAPRSPWVPRDIAARCPSAKFIYIVREPIRRLISQHAEAVDQFYEWRSLEEYIRTIDRNEEYPLETSRYYFQLSRYLDVFERSRLKVLILEECLQDMAGTLSDLAEFLDLPEVAILKMPMSPINPRAEKRAPNALGKWIARDRSRRTLLTENILPWRIRLLLQAVCRAAPTSVDSQVLSTDMENHLVGLLADDIKQFKRFLGREIAVWPRFIG
jgi:Sulfotransferase family